MAKIGRALLVVLVVAWSVVAISRLLAPSFWKATHAWAQSATPPKLVLPKVVRDYLKQHPTAEADNDTAPNPDDLLSVSKHDETEEMGETGHTDGSPATPNYVAFHYLTIVAKTDDITIDEVVGNRGNCPLNKGFYREELPAHLKFGQSVKIPVGCDSLIEVEAKTSAGSLTYSWDN